MAKGKHDSAEDLFDVVEEKKQEAKVLNENKLDSRIVLRAVYGKQQGHIKIRPALDQQLGRVFTGQNPMSDDEKRKAPLVIDSQTSYTLYDGITFDKQDPIHMTHWKWISSHPYVAKDFDSAQNSPNAFFYIEDIEADLDKKASRREKIYEALKLIKESSQDKKAEICRLLGTPVEHWAPKQITDFLEDNAMSNPDRIIITYGDKNYKVRLFIYKCIDKKLITLQSGVYKYNDISLGLSEAQCIEWLKAPENAKFVELLKQGLING